MKEEIHLDPRLEKVDLADAVAVFKALGGEPYISSEKFDLEAYLALPIGKRLLTKEEVVTLPIEKRKPVPDYETDPFYWEWFSDGVIQSNGGSAQFEYNWDPEKKCRVYETSIPNELVEKVEKVKGPNALALEDKEREMRLRIAEKYAKEDWIVRHGGIITE